jgi:hypothetical protein
MPLPIDRSVRLEVTNKPMQTKEQLGAQFTWELKNIKKDLESFLEMSRAEQLNFAPTLCSRIQVTSARLKLFKKTLGQVVRQET